MIKTTLKLMVLLFATSIYAQTFSTGTVTLRAGYTAKVDVSPTLVTLTQVGPSDRWFALAFNNISMSAGDIVAFINTSSISDRSLGGFFVPSADGAQDWTTTSNTVSGSVRTVVSTRVLNTGDANDFVFSNTANMLGLGWSVSSSASFSLAPHGGGANAGQVVASLTLGNNEFAVDSFKMYPNPLSGNILNFSSAINAEMNVQIFDLLGKQILTSKVNNNTLNVSNLNAGIYIVKITEEGKTATRKLVVK